MASSFPKMQKGSANFSQSIRNRLRLKNLQAQAKNFCRVLDIRVSQVVKSDVSQSICLEQLRKTLSDIMGLDQITNLVNADITDVVLDVAASAQAAIFLLLVLQSEKPFSHERNKWKCSHA